MANKQTFSLAMVLCLHAEHHIMISWWSAIVCLNWYCYSCHVVHWSNSFDV